LRGTIKDVEDRERVVSGVFSHLCAVNFWAGYQSVAILRYKRIDPSPVLEPSPQPKPETHFVTDRYL
jgi:hypothetical protein